MSFTLLILAFSAFAGWAVLSLIGGERSRRLSEIEVENAAAQALAADTAATLAATTAAATAAAKQAQAASWPAARHSGH